jgi:hypothetical protein
MCVCIISIISNDKLGVWLVYARVVAGVRTHGLEIVTVLK